MNFFFLVEALQGVVSRGGVGFMAFLRPYRDDDRTHSRSAHGLPRLQEAVDAVVLELLQPQVGSGQGLPCRLRLQLGTELFIKQWIKG